MLWMQYCLVDKSSRIKVQVKYINIGLEEKSSVYLQKEIIMPIWDVYKDIQHIIQRNRHEQKGGEIRARQCFHIMSQELES